MIEKFSVVIVEDARLELKGTEEIFRTEIPEADVIGVASNEKELDEVLGRAVPDLLLLDLGLGGSTTVGVDICARVKKEHPEMKVLVFTGEYTGFYGIFSASFRCGLSCSNHHVGNQQAGITFAVFHGLYHIQSPFFVPGKIFFSVYSIIKVGILATPWIL